MIDYLLIGHVSLDLTPEGVKPGGAVTFASHVARELHYKTAVLTSASPVFDLHAAFPDDVEVICLPSAQTTTFENIYAADGSRRQRLHAVANTIGASDVPPEWRNAKIVHLAPIAEEIEPTIIDAFPDSMICTTP